VSRDNGFLQLRRGLWAHRRDGRMSVTETLAFIYICSQADTRTGVWIGSAGALHIELGIAERTARDVLEKMERGSYIRRFTSPGSHTCYPILVHKFEITQGEHDGEQLNALESKNPTELAYFSREHNGELSVEHAVEHSAAQRRKENREKRIEKKEEAPAVPSPSVFTGQHLSVTQKQDAVLGEAFPWVDRPAEYRRVDSWLEANPRKRPKKFPQFLHNWFNRITQPKGKAHGKDINEAVATTMRGFAVNARITN
jgi:hypothetical protein